MGPPKVPIPQLILMSLLEKRDITAEVAVRSTTGNISVHEDRANLAALADIRRRREWEMRSSLSFAQLVSELDAAQGGQALSHLVPRKVDPAPGEWMSARGRTWGQMMQDPQQTETQADLL